MIPKRIHYCWFGRNPLPQDVKKCMESWKRFCPDYEITEWNESNFDINCHPFVKSAYEAKAWAFVSDYARLKVVYDHGGIYLDTDVELLKNPDFLLNYPCYIGVQQVGHFCTTGLGYGAVKGNPTVKRMIMQYDGLVYKKEDIENVVCPRMNHKVMVDLGYRFCNEVTETEGVLILPPRYLDPLVPGDTTNLLCKDTVSIHHYSASWTSTSNKWKRKIFRMIGAERLYKVKRFLKYKKKEKLE